MKKEHIDYLIPEYLEGLLSNKQKDEVEQHLGQCADCNRELEEYRMMLRTFNAQLEEVPHQKVREGFFKLLENEKDGARTIQRSKPGTNYKKWPKTVLKYAALLALLVSSYLFGSYQSEIESSRAIAMLKEKNLDMRQTAMLSLMENKSASRRIQGVSYIDSLTKPNEDILNALTERMLNDENANVRLTAVKAMTNLTSSQIVRKGFIKALKSEKNPNIQITIIHALVKMQSKNVIAPMQQLLDQKNTEPFVKEQIKSLMPNIT